jgi:hypothetical protein
MLLLLLLLLLLGATVHATTSDSRHYLDKHLHAVMAYHTLELQG